MFKLLLAEKRSPPSTFFLIYAFLTCIVSQYTVVECLVVSFTNFAYTLQVPVLLAQKLNVISCQLKPNLVLLGWLG